MRNSIKIILLLVVFSVSAQIPVIPLAQDSDLINGAYYKDINHDFDQFIGTWQYVHDNTNFIVTLQKKQMQHVIHTPSLSVYEDFLVGGYIYRVNGQELVNTMPQLSMPLLDVFKYNLYSMAILHNNGRPKCYDCMANEKRVAVSFNDPIRQIDGLRGILVLRKVIENGNIVLKANLISEGNLIVKENQQPVYNEFMVPFGEYVLTKVN